LNGKWRDIERLYAELIRPLADLYPKLESGQTISNVSYGESRKRAT
jgi:hypothetical protein